MNARAQVAVSVICWLGCFGLIVALKHERKQQGASRCAPGRAPLPWGDAAGVRGAAIGRYDCQ